MVAVSGARTAANVYDGFGRLSSTSTNMGGNTRTLTYQYDRDGNRTRITHPDGNYFNTTYDGLDRPLLLQANGATTISGNEYYAHGGLWVLNRIATATEINYDQVQRPYVLHHYLGGAADVVWTSQFNALGQVLSTVRTNDAYAWTGHYAVNRAYVTNGLNQYSAAGGTTLGYDLNGNLTSSGASAYLYDIENRMVGAPGGVALTYDPLGRLFQVSNASTTTQFLYDGDAMVAEYNGSNVLQRRHVHNLGADVPMVTYEGTGLGTIRQLYADRQGSIVTLANGSGVTTAINIFDEYGIPGSANSGRFGYTGQAWLQELRLYYYKARFYSPTLGRFMQVDPIGYQDQFNLYAYVGNDLVNAIDPSGERCESADGRTTCTPEDESFSSFSFPTPEGWEDFAPSSADFHSYHIDVAMGQGDQNYGALLQDELIQNSTPGEGAASPGGTLIDVNVPGPWGADHVMSYTRQDSSGNTFVANVTQQDHVVNSGFIVRQVVPDSRGGFTLRTYGEGNSWKQAGVFGGTAHFGERAVWVGSARAILENARVRRANR